jgi:hypothetical protein
MKTGKALIDYLYAATFRERAECLINEIEPYLSKGMNPVDSSYLTREEALNITISRAVEFFGCKTKEIVDCYLEYKYYFPIDDFKRLFLEDRGIIIEIIPNKEPIKRIKKFIPEIDSVILDNSAQRLWNDVKRPEIDKEIENCLRSGLPLSECVKNLTERYKGWAIAPNLKGGKNLSEDPNSLLYFCWINHMEPYLKELIPDEANKQIVSGYTVKSIIMAYYYMHRKAIYPIKELEGIWVIKNIHKKLNEIYGCSINSLRNDWKPITSNLNNRLQQPDTIKESIEIIKTFSYPNIQDAIDLATDELKKAELKKN